MVMTDGWIIGFWYVWFLILKIVCFAQISYSLLDNNVGVFYSRLALIFRCVLRVLVPLFFTTPHLFVNGIMLKDKMLCPYTITLNYYALCSRVGRFEI